MKVRLIKKNPLKKLMEQIPNNLEVYRDGRFDSLQVDPENYFELEQEFNEEELTSIECSEREPKEIENCKLMLKALGGLSNYLARDERIWVYLTHTLLLDYSRKRWPIPQDDAEAVKHIKNHFFVVGARGFERDNAVSRLWWMATLCDRAVGISLDTALTCILERTDVRANIIERPTTSQSVHVFSAILKKLNDSYKKDQYLFQRKPFREFMKRLNLAGGVKLLAAMEPADVEMIVNECMPQP